MRCPGCLPEATTAEAAPTAYHQGRDHRMGGPGNRGGAALLSFRCSVLPQVVS